MSTSIDLSKFPVETIPYKGYFVYSVPASFGNVKTHDDDRLVYIPAVEGSANPKLAEVFMDYEKSRDEKTVSEDKLDDIKKKLSTIFDETGKMMASLLGTEKCKFGPTVVELPQVKRDKKNYASVWELRTWPPCENKHEAWHFAMSMVDLFIKQQKINFAKGQN